MALYPCPSLIKVTQFERVGLIEKFEDIGVMIHDENRPQLDFVALKLNRHVHFGTGIGSTYIVRTRIDATNRLGGANTCQEIARRGCKCERTAPLLKI